MLFDLQETGKVSSIIPVDLGLTLCGHVVGIEALRITADVCPVFLDVRHMLVGLCPKFPSDKRQQVVTGITVCKCRRIVCNPANRTAALLRSDVTRYVGTSDGAYVLTTMPPELRTQYEFSPSTETFSAAVSGSLLSQP